MKMNLPRFNDKRKEKRLRMLLKTCKYKDPFTGEKCEKEYYGKVMQKYCDFHKNPDNRKRKRTVESNHDFNNQKFNNKFMEFTNVECICELEGCNNSFIIQVIKKISIYPRFCEEHRNRYRRELFLSQIKKAA